MEVSKHDIPTSGLPLNSDGAVVLRLTRIARSPQLRHHLRTSCRRRHSSLKAQRQYFFLCGVRNKTPAAIRTFSEPPAWRHLCLWPYFGIYSGRCQYTLQTSRLPSASAFAMPCRSCEAHEDPGDDSLEEVNDDVSEDPGDDESVEEAKDDVSE
jgi:hypothetical protein